MRFLQIFVCFWLHHIMSFTLSFNLKNESELITCDACCLLSPFEFRILSKNTQQILASKNGTDVLQVFLKRSAFLKRSCLEIVLVPPDGRLWLAERFPSVCKSGAKLEMSGANLEKSFWRKQFLFSSSTRIISSKTDLGWSHSLHPARHYFHLLFFAPDLSIFMPCVPPSLLRAQTSPKLHSLSPSVQYPVLLTQVGFAGAQQSSCSDILGWEKPSSSAPYAPGAAWWGFVPLGAFLKHTCPSSSAVTLVTLWTNTSLIWLDVSVCASNTINTAVPSPVTQCSCFSRRKKGFKQAGN